MALTFSAWEQEGVYLRCYIHKGKGTKVLGEITVLGVANLPITYMRHIPIEWHWLVSTARESKPNTFPLRNEGIAATERGAQAEAKACAKRIWGR